MKKLAVIGLGSIAARHRRNLRLLFPEAEIYALSSSGREIKEDIPYSNFIMSDVDALIKERMDMVIVASPATYHSLHAIPLIEAGIPCLIEKPLAASIEDVSCLHEVMKIHGTPVAVAYCLRYSPSLKLVKDLLSQSKLGRLYNFFVQVGQYLPDWRSCKSYQDSVSAKKNLGGGALLELSHELDYSLWILGKLELHYSMLRSSDELSFEVEDLVDVMVESKDGVVGHIHLDFLQKQAHRCLSFVGSKGRLEWDFIANKVDFISRDGIQTLYDDSSWDKNEMYLDMIKDFVCMTKGEPNRCITVSAATETINLIHKIKEGVISY